MRDIQRRFLVNGANCMLREKLGVLPASSITGPGYWAKTALYGAAKVSGLLEAKRRQRRPITFHLDQKTPGTIVEVA